MSDINLYVPIGGEKRVYIGTFPRPILVFPFDANEEKQMKHTQAARKRLNEVISLLEDTRDELCQGDDDSIRLVDEIVQQLDGICAALADGRTPSLEMLRDAREYSRRWKVRR